MPGEAVNAKYMTIAVILFMAFSFINPVVEKSGKRFQINAADGIDPVRLTRLSCVKLPLTSVGGGIGRNSPGVALA